MSSAPGIVSKKLKFKGEKPKKKKRTHREVGGSDDDAAAGEDPTGWTLPKELDELVGPAFILLPTEPPTCLAWESTRQRVYAAPVTLPELPEGTPKLTLEQVAEIAEPTDVNHVWVITRLSGAEEVISLRSSSGTFLAAASSGALSAANPSRGPLESFTPILNSSASTDSKPSPSSSSRPSFSLKSSSEKFVSVSEASTKLTVGGPRGQQFELRADSEEVGNKERWIVKCQREYIIKARRNRNSDDPLAGRKKVTDLTAGGGIILNEGTLEDEQKRNHKYQAWGQGRSVVSGEDRKELKKARKEGKLSEAMLDRRSKLKQ